MTPTHRRRARARTVSVAAGLALATSLSSFVGAVHADDDPADPADPATIDLTEQVAALVDQTAPKNEPTAGEIAGTDVTRGANPYLSPSSDADYRYWDTLLAARAAARAARSAGSAAAATTVAAPVVDEREPDDLFGRNDSLATAETAAIGAAPSDVRIIGTLADTGLADPIAIGPFAEDDGAIPLASPTGLSDETPAVRAAATIGDGPHGTAGSGTGDFDVFALPGLTAGQQLTADVDAAVNGSALDAFVVLVAADGTVIAVDDDGPEIDFDSFLEATIPADGDYLVAVTGFGALPSNPFDSASGNGARSEGDYELELRLDFVEDVDVFAFDADAGDVLSATVTGGAEVLSIFGPDGTLAMRQGRDLSATFPEDTPLLGGGNAAVDHIAAATGRHYLMVNRGTGVYDVRVRRLRPALESAAPGEHQIVFVDVDGAQLNTDIFDGNGVSTLSPLAGFLGGWGLGADDEDAVIDAALAEIEENLVGDPRFAAINPGYSIEVRNSRDHADPWGQPNVTRVVIGGSRAETGVDTISISQSLDPGNFDREETALIQLDTISAPAGSVQNTINNFVTPDTDVPELVGYSLGFLSTFHLSQMFGSNFTDGANGVAGLMDAPLGSPNAGIITSLGPDLEFGTDDDVDVDLATDTLFDNAGIHDSVNQVAWGLSSSLVAGPGEPENVAASLNGRRVTVSWTPPALGEGVTGYVVRAMRDGDVVATRTVGAHRTSVRMPRLADGEYVFSVAATGDTGEGAPITIGPLAIGSRRS